MSQLHVDLRTHVRELPGVRVGVVLWGGLALLDVAGIAGLGGTVELLLMAAVVAACSRRTTTGVALLIAVVGWLLVNGFVVHAYGQLHYTGAGDLLRLGLLVIAALLGRR